MLRRLIEARIFEKSYVCLLNRVRVVAPIVGVDFLLLHHRLLLALLKDIYLVLVPESLLETGCNRTASAVVRQRVFLEEALHVAHCHVQQVF